MEQSSYKYYKYKKKYLELKDNQDGKGNYDKQFVYYDKDNKHEYDKQFEKTEMTYDELKRLNKEDHFDCKYKLCQFDDLVKNSLQFRDAITRYTHPETGDEYHWHNISNKWEVAPKTLSSE